MKTLYIEKQSRSETIPVQKQPTPKNYTRLETTHRVSKNKNINKKQICLDWLLKGLVVERIIT